MPKNPPPCEPELPSDNLDEIALSAVKALLQVTRDILAQGVAPDYPQLSQWILQRGMLLDAVRRLPLDDVSDAVRPQILELLMQARELDAQVEKNLNACYTELDSQLKGVKDTRALMDKYRASGSEASGTYSQDA